jgi:hypothetical protein
MKIRLRHSPDGSNYTGYKLVRFLPLLLFHQEENDLAFTRDKHCHLALCSDVAFKFYFLFNPPDDQVSMFQDYFSLLQNKLGCLSLAKFLT